MSSKLYRVINGRREYERMRDKVFELEAIAEKITPTLSQMPRGNSGNPKDDAWAKLIDYKTECEWLLSVYLNDCQELEHELQVIRDDTIRVAMQYKYIDGMTVESIAEKMGYTPRNISYCLAKGRKIYEKYYEEY